VVVIGFGSPIRGDDALGPLVADQLADTWVHAPVTVLSRHILTAELATMLHDASLVVFIDASVDGPPGEIVTRELVADVAGALGLAHAVDPRGLLAWTQALYGRAPRAMLVSTRGATFNYAHYALSDAVQAALPPLIETVRRLIDQHLQTA
jgi:hydrogenase maturation protease